VYDATVTPADTEAMVQLLDVGAIEVLALMPWSSNGTFLVQVSDRFDHAPAIYKPSSAERPLWDFPGGLWKREVATWELSEVLGFAVVPPTVGRNEAPMGAGSLQAFVPARFEEHYFTLRDTTDDTLATALRKLCVLDLVANATDRKGGHCLVDANNRLWAIDNGLSFHEEFKLRTVIWDFAGEEIPESMLTPLRELVSDRVPDRLSRWLSEAEVAATVARAVTVLESARFPHDMTGQRYPWPLV
jgi:uncharacterized repeat protein (TIGR03843 family)